jgi:hypothetical protein
MLPRLLILSLFLPACVAPAAAQSSPDKTPASSRLPSSPSPQNYLTLQHEPPFLAQAQSLNTQNNQLQQPLHSENFSLSPKTPAAVPALRLASPVPQASGNKPATLAQNTQQCYALRTYRFSQEDPRSDSTKFADYTVCQSGAEFHMKTAVQEVNSR